VTVPPMCPVRLGWCSTIFSSTEELIVTYVHSRFQIPQLLELAACSAPKLQSLAIRLVAHDPDGDSDWCNTWPDWCTTWPAIEIDPEQLNQIFAPLANFSSLKCLKLREWDVQGHGGDPTMPMKYLAGLHSLEVCTFSHGTHL